MISSAGRSPGSWLTCLLAVTFVLAGYWAVSEDAESPGEASRSAKPTIAPKAAKGTAVGPSKAAAPASKSNEKSAPERPPEPLLKGWTKPQLAIVLSGEQMGYLEPCGCSAKQSGGFARRGDLFEQLRAKQWPVAAFDLGGTLKRSRRHDLLKFQAILKGLGLMHYQALGLGPAELRLGAENLLSLHSPEKGLAFVSCNIVFFGDIGIGTPLPYKIVEMNGVKVGVTGVISDFYRDQVLPRGNPVANQPITVTDAVVGVSSAVQKMSEKKPDLMVLLSYCKVDETKDLAKKVPDFDIIITAGGPEEPIERTEQIGKSMLVQVGGKGKHVAVIGYYPDNTKQPLKYELVDLDKTRFKNNPAMVRLMEEFQGNLMDENLGETEPGLVHESGAGFVGAKKCGVCHTKAYKKWLNTPHARAFDDLKTGPHYPYEGKWINRQFDSECLACHVTGWDPREVVKFETGFESFAKTPHLAGQQCENCHGPGSEHVKTEELLKKTRKGNDPAIARWRQKMHLDTTMVQKETGCYKCHDGDNSPKFNFEEYYKKIEHRTLKD
jgi:hypothetical protein